MNAGGVQRRVEWFPVKGYALEATLAGGQAFRWRGHGDVWEGVVDGRWVRVRGSAEGLEAEWMEIAEGSEFAPALQRYLGLDLDLERVVATFPDDAPMRASCAACRGLRLLRQPAWECLASFICSSTKQIVQIQQIVSLLCERHGVPVPVPESHAEAYAFPTIPSIAGCTERQLRDCKLGFRAPYLLGTAQMLESGAVSLEAIDGLETPAAREVLMGFPGVGRKVADCVLLFGYGRQDAFPVDVWVQKALQRLYFEGKRRRTLRQLLEFSARHFGPYAGYAQQYLFQYARSHLGRAW